MIGDRKLSDWIDDEKVYEIDIDTEEGQEAIAFANSVVKDMLQTIPHYRKAIKAQQTDIKSGEVYGLKKKIFRPVGNTESFLTSHDGMGGILDYKEVQKAMTFTDKNGKQYVMSIDRIIAEENDVMEVIMSSTTNINKVNQEIKKINSLSRKQLNKIEIETKWKLDVDTYLQQTWNINDPTAFAKYFLDGIPKGLQRGAAKEAKIQEWRLLKNTIMEHNPKLKESEVDAYMASMLQRGIDDIGKPQVDKASGKIQMAANPQESLLLLELDTTKALFLESGIEEDHYDALLGLYGHMVLVHGWEEMASKANPNLPQYDLSDTGLMSRAFNYARGMVSGEYILVEAGFRIMRDNDIRLMDWLLNDPKSAEIMFRMLDHSPAKPIRDFDATTLLGRMRAWIARTLAVEAKEIDLLFEEDIGEDEYASLGFWKAKPAVDRLRKRNLVQTQLGESVRTGTMKEGDWLGTPSETTI